MSNKGKGAGKKTGVERIEHFHAHGKSGCLKESHKKKMQKEERVKQMKKRVKHVLRKRLVRPWKKVFGRRESWIGTFYLH